MCKKELSSNRINDPLASIYRTRGKPGEEGGGRVGGRTRGEDELVELSSRKRSGSCFHVVLLPVQTPCAGNIICFLAVLEVYARRRKFNRPTLSLSGRVCKSCFRCLHPFAGYGTSVQLRCRARKEESIFPICFTAKEIRSCIL